MCRSLYKVSIGLQYHVYLLNPLQVVSALCDIHSDSEWPTWGQPTSLACLLSPLLMSTGMKYLTSLLLQLYLIGATKKKKFWLNDRHLCLGLACIGINIKYLLIGVIRTPMDIPSQCFQHCEKKSWLPEMPLSLDTKARNGTAAGKVHSLALVKDAGWCVYEHQARHPRDMDIRVLGHNWP